jgi:DNA repair protein RadC
VTFFHNHPSGNPTPSQADIRLTGLLKTALKTVDIRTLDHIVIGAADTRPVSFAEQGLI